MDDMELSEIAKREMVAHNYDKAISSLRKMKQEYISIRMEFLVIEHEQNYIRGKESESNITEQ